MVKLSHFAWLQSKLEETKQSNEDETTPMVNVNVHVAEQPRPHRANYNAALLCQVVALEVQSDLQQLILPTRLCHPATNLLHQLAGRLPA